MSAPVLVTGAEGFVGGHLLAELGDEARPLEADVLNASALQAALRGEQPRAVVHLAALSSVGGSWKDASEVWRVNALGTVLLLQAVAEAAGGARVLVVSTGEVYGRAGLIPTPEEAPLVPVSPYAASKAAAEMAARQAHAAGLDVVVARPFQHEGPGRDERFAVGSWTRQIAELEQAGGGTLLVGDLTAKRDLTDVRDVCRAYRALLDPAVPAATYNVSTGRAVGMDEVVQMLIGLARSPIEVEQDPARIRPAEIPVLAGDPARLNAETGWEPAIPLEQTLADALDYARNAVSDKAGQT